MKRSLVPAVPDSKREAFTELTGSPDIAYKTIVYTVVLAAVVVYLDYLAVTGVQEYWVVCIATSLLMYGFFTPAHDGIHRAITRNKLVNDGIAQMVIWALAPYVSISLFRWAHMEHHRFTNDERDPDTWLHGPVWSLPFRWALVDIYYAFRAITSKNPGVRKLVIRSLPIICGGIAVLITLVAMGYGEAVLFLWLIPSRVVFLLAGFSFFWLPHAHWPNDQHDLRQSHNPTIASVVRKGNEWVVSPLLQNQNYHLIHHLWPTTPFYNNKKVWDLLEDEIMANHDIAMAKNFSIQPELKFANK
jgi:fatty acid desaturase